MMWDTVAIISDAVEASMPDTEKNKLERKIYGKLSDGHYNEYYAMEDVAGMTYRDSKTGVIHKAPFWTTDMVRNIYESLKGELRNYNCWDFYVTMHMIVSDNYALLDKWFPGIDDNERNSKYVELAVNWLKDEDSPYGTSKIWHYLNG